VTGKYRHTQGQIRHGEALICATSVASSHLYKNVM
jgi:hypothetical protein